MYKEQLKILRRAAAKLEAFREIAVRRANFKAAKELDEAFVTVKLAIAEIEEVYDQHLTGSIEDPRTLPPKEKPCL